MLRKIRRNVIMTMGAKIKQLRSKKGLSQEKLAEKLNVSRSAVANGKQMAVFLRLIIYYSYH